jgi:hypothetical protein
LSVRRWYVLAHLLNDFGSRSQPHVMMSGSSIEMALESARLRKRAEIQSEPVTTCTLLTKAAARQRAPKSLLASPNGSNVELAF